jgi:hypothetical protein
MHENFIRELCAPSHCSVEGVGRYLTQRLTLVRGHFPRQSDVEFASWRAEKLDWRLLGEREIDENGRIIDLNL